MRHLNAGRRNGADLAGPPRVSLRRCRRGFVAWDSPGRPGDGGGVPSGVAQKIGRSVGRERPASPFVSDFYIIVGDNGAVGAAWSERSPRPSGRAALSQSGNGTVMLIMGSAAMRTDASVLRLRFYPVAPSRSVTAVAPPSPPSPAHILNASDAWRSGRVPPLRHLEANPFPKAGSLRFQLQARTTAL